MGLFGFGKKKEEPMFYEETTKTKHGTLTTQVPLSLKLKELRRQEYEKKYTELALKRAKEQAIMKAEARFPQLRQQPKPQSKGFQGTWATFDTFGTSKRNPLNTPLKLSKPTVSYKKIGKYYKKITHRGKPIPQQNQNFNDWFNKL